MYISSSVILPFEVKLTAWQTIIEWDDRYDPPQETSYERTTTVTLKAGQKESDHIISGLEYLMVAVGVGTSM
ncbi:hypothetical protein [Bacteroides eggerthii]|uniref:hypothetical protein n=1 Tax=Bacteroides eggerthii TaxID=28111 RepID=UPI000E206761|nr:hypothetical protein [Bacteroides eggerthii]